MKKTIITKSDKETFDFAKDFSKGLKGGEVIFLEGDLGAGKTVFTKGLSRGLGYGKNVSSPTFVLMRVYELEKNKKINTICHVDAYRLGSEDELLSIGIKDYINEPKTIVIIEWSNKIKKKIAEKVVKIKISFKSETSREIKISNLP
ncbi:tRNA (adenosine(37)-N6)-threonylcarbamoyltransferase complex ATPase subunit type 1 TsaE [bacterium]|nr:tRNA (adenosine(37)-N6)-threonylcarbamoyltransferase complex ATPase subunit type 1 TsaE [bacterium]